MMISKGFKWKTWQKRSVCWLIIPPVFLQGDLKSFQILFHTLDQFPSFSGCKVNMSKSEAIHIGSLRNSDVFPFQDSSFRWRSNPFKTLGINFSLNVNSLSDLNFVPKLRQSEQTLNCWKHRNLSHQIRYGTKSGTSVPDPVHPIPQCIGQTLIISNF